MPTLSYKSANIHCFHLSWVYSLTMHMREIHALVDILICCAVLFLPTGMKVVCLALVQALERLTLSRTQRRGAQPLFESLRGHLRLKRAFSDAVPL